MYVIETKKIKKNRSGSVGLLLKGSELNRKSRLRFVRKEITLTLKMSAV